MAKLYFHGGVGEVTGANFLLETRKGKIAFDCGMVQGSTESFKKNYIPFAYDPTSVDYLIISHAHLDHIGKIPNFISQGFKGTIISTPATKDLAKLILDDAQKVSTQKAQELGLPPLYTQEEVKKSFTNWKTLPYHEKMDIFDYTLEFKDAGHILGSAISVLQGKTKFAYTGDLGNSPAPILKDTEMLKGIDYMIMESVYGNRNHEDKKLRKEKLKSAIEYVLSTGGTLLIPAFAMQRSQIIIYEINKMVESGELPEIPVYLDSPLAIKITEVFRNYTHLFNDNVQKRIEAGDDIFDFPKFVETVSPIHSKKIEKREGPKVIISASGMSTGGRILMHERHILSDKRNLILFVGYQAVGTIGRMIQEGVKKVKINNEWIKVRAKIRSIRGYSAHKDMDHLVEFVESTADSIKKCFVTMGEPKSSLFLTQRLREYLEIDATAPSQGESYEIEI